MKIKVVLRANKINKQGQSPLMLRFTHDRTTKFVALGLSVEPCYWDKDAEIVLPACPERVLLQSRIDSTLASYRKKIQRLEALDMKVDFESLFDQTSKCTPQLVGSYFGQQIAIMKQAGKINTAIKYTATRTSLGKFHPAKLRFEDITPNLLADFEAFLHGAGNQPNSIATKFSVLKAVYNKAIVDKIFLCKENLLRFIKWENIGRRHANEPFIKRIYND